MLRDISGHRYLNQLTNLRCSLSARFLHQEWFDFDPTHKVFFGTNHKPVIRGTDYAIWRRIRLVPFEITIPEAERDKALPERLKEEADGIFAWAIQGCLLWKQRGLGAPEEVREATASYRDEMDSLTYSRSVMTRP